MEKIALIFPGQGSQFIGMGKGLYDNHDIAKKTFEEANDVLGFDLAGLCFEGNLVDLNRMENMFTAILTCSMATFRVYLSEIGVLPQFLAGHSLGEYSALTCAGVMRFEDALKIVRLRGELAQQLADEGTGAMTIIEGIDSGIVAQECEKYSYDSHVAEVSCYNSPNQVAISGHQDAVMKVEDRVLELGGQITPLIGGAPFHGVLMKKISEVLRSELEKYNFRVFRYPVVSNVSGCPYPGVEKVPEILSKQLICPVMWDRTMHCLNRFGITVAIEMGPKNLLANFVKSNTPGIESLCFGQKEDRKTIESVFLSDEKLTRHIPTVITKCMSIAVATPNANWDRDEYDKGVIQPYRKIQEIHNILSNAGSKPNKEQMLESLGLLKTIFATKKLPAEEQREWFEQIFDETGTNYSFEDFELPA